MGSADVLRPNTPMVISEIVEDEVVLVNFDSGSYYSLAGSGTQVWRALELGATAPEILDAVLGHFGGPRDEVEAAVTSFLDELIAEELVVADGQRTADSNGTVRGSASFVAPRLERFDDMRDMLLLDPIHDVDEGGWPNAKPPAE